MKELIGSWSENVTNKINIGFGSNVKFWILGFLIFYWKFLSLKDKKIKPGTEQLNMFVYPSSLNEYRENKRRTENQRKLHDKNFFSFMSKRNENYDQTSMSYNNYNSYGENNSNYNLNYYSQNQSNFNIKENRMDEMNSYENDTNSTMYDYSENLYQKSNF